jgi:predicted ArsR family transcriptional regulator
MDQKVVDTALRDASRIVAEYFRSEPRNVDKTIVKLSEVLDDQRFAAAVQRLDAER